jgi:type VI secretion system protein ImpF
MSTYRLQQELLPSLLDRLTDLEPRVRYEAPLSRAQAMRQIKGSLRRDLEWLLNSRRTGMELKEWMRELKYSLFRYGLPDTADFSWTNSGDQDRLTREIEETVEQFEPRLMNISVTLQAPSASARQLKFTIEALLRLEPAPERILFDTMLEMTNGEYRVEE